MAKPQLWVKSYPYPNEVAALADLGQQDIGMEIFLGGDSKKNDECMKICQDNYPKTGIELFFYHGEEKRQREVIVDPLSNNPNLSKLSRDYLFESLDLALKYKATHLQLDGGTYIAGPGSLMGEKEVLKAISDKKELLAEIKQRYGDFPIYFENTFPINEKKPIFSLTGHRMSDFWKLGLPLEYDIAHHAVALDIYSRAEEFNFPLNEEEKNLARKVKNVGITAVILEELEHFPEIYFTQLSNAQHFSFDIKPDVSPEDQTKALISMDNIIPVLLAKSLNVAPEVEDKDYVERPNLRAWVKNIQDII
ncbi:MAG TPA: hypothetical protein VJC39_00195, partial [Candidatus Nanoarchaeia archaeon]|nr:hypothetical protein [Candidatus Nanoarchaeia archaeon]